MTTIISDDKNLVFLSDLSAASDWNNFLERSVGIIIRKEMKIFNN